MNNTTINTKTMQADNSNNGDEYSFFMLDTVSLGAIQPLAEAVFELAAVPVQTLTHFFELLRNLYKQKREQEVIDLLYVLYGMFGIEYADTIRLLRGDTEARSYFIYSYIVNLGELLEELTERGGA